MHIFLLTLYIYHRRERLHLIMKKKVVKVPRKYRWAGQSVSIFFLQRLRENAFSLTSSLILVPVLNHCKLSGWKASVASPCCHFLLAWESRLYIYIYLYTSKRAYAASLCLGPLVFPLLLKMKHGLRLYMFKHRRRHKRHTRIKLQQARCVPLGIFNMAENCLAQHFGNVVVN